MNDTQSIVMIFGLFAANYIMWLDWNRNLTTIESEMAFDERAIA
jgi:hypothetical protein